MKLSTIQNERMVTIEDLKKHNQNVVGVIPFEYRKDFIKNY